MRNLVINAAYGSWYPKGQKRLVESLRDTGYRGDILTWCNEKINSYHNPKHPYTIKVAAWHEAIIRGYEKIFWLDSSVYAVKDITSMFDTIEEDQVYFWRSGWNLAQTATDKDLEFAEFTRDEAEGMYECASGIVGINLSWCSARKVMNTFFNAYRAGVCSTSRNHDNQSSDPRFKFGRQDQTAFTIAFHKSGFTNEDMYDQNIHCTFMQENYPESVYLKVSGL